MRIMIVTDQYPPMIGGVPAITHDLAHDFANRGHQVGVIAPSYCGRNITCVEQKVLIYRFSSFKCPTYKELRISLLPVLPMHRLLEKFDPDIIHIHAPVVLGNIAQLLARRLRIPVITTLHVLPVNISRSLTSHALFSKPFNEMIYRMLVHFCNRCNFVTAPTWTAVNLLYAHNLRTPAQVISNGIDRKRFSPGERNLHFRQRFNFPTDRPIILSVNRLSFEKRIDVLIDAAAKMTGNAQVLIAGTGPAEAELKAQTQRLQVQGRVTFLGFIHNADLVDLYRLADVFAVPSEAELQSLATMEAMACGLPVLAANVLALPELVSHEGNGFLFQPGDSGELATYIDILVGNITMREQLGAKSLEIIANHDREQVVNQLESLYHRLAYGYIKTTKQD